MTRYDFSEVYAGLKDFQRTTVEYAFQRMYLDDDPARRFLVADEVGLGKTLVARGLIARAIEHLRAAIASAKSAAIVMRSASQVRE